MASKYTVFIPYSIEHVDITEGISRQLTIHSCRTCQRFLCPPWQNIALESKELMSVCLRKIPGLSKVKLIDAVWIWTEPHSMTLKIKLSIQKEVINGAILQQALLIEFTIRNQQCTSCQASFATGAWHAVVQVRQRVPHKRTFFFIEQLLLKHNAHSDSVNIVTFKDGMDFYFIDKNQAIRFIDFLEGNVPMKSKYSRKLVSADHTSNIGNFKHNYICDIAPLCKDDLLILPRALAKNLSDISPLVLVKGIGAGIHILDPFTCERQEINAEKYWRYCFPSIMNSRQLIRYVVLSIDALASNHRASAKKRGMDRKLRLAECVVAREKDLGVNDVQFTTTTHLGHLLRVGDVALGYDFSVASWTHDLEVNDIRKVDLPDVMLVRKHFPTKSERIWALKTLQTADERVLTNREQEAEEKDYEDFLQELESDRELRSQVNMYKNSRTAASGSKGKKEVRMEGMDEEEEEDEDDEEDVQLEELLDDLMVGEELDEEVTSSTVILSSAEAEGTARGSHVVDLQISPFDLANIDPSTLKFD